MDWKPIDQCPYDGTTFLAAVKVDNSLTGKSHWEYALMFMDEGLLHFSDEFGDTGWNTDDYTRWTAIVPPQK